MCLARRISPQSLVVAKGNWDLRFHGERVAFVFVVTTTAQIVLASMVYVFADGVAFGIFKAFEDLMQFQEMIILFVVVQAR